MEKGKREFLVTIFGLLLFTASVSYWFNSVDPTAQPVAEIQRIQHIAAVETNQPLARSDSYPNIAFASNNHTNATNHTACRNYACVVIQGAGKNQCTSNYDCRNMTNITIKQVNVTKVFNETNQTNTTHLTCRNYACVTVQGPGVDQCIDTRDCLNATNTTWLVFKTIVNVTGSGFNTSNATGGGLSGADVVCNNEARLRGFGGSYVAWLSTRNIDAQMRIVPGTYKNIYGAIIAYSRMDLIDGSLTNAIEPNVRADIWTGTGSNGKYAGINCNDWTSSSTQYSGAMGSSNQVNYGWTYYAGGRCDLAKSLYCFQVR
ncbi:MAG: DUF1554 domain-containing protein [Nanoarchaeota archaeon]